MDTRAARLEITKSPLSKECVYWLDLGNTADGGQFILGQPKNDRNRKTPGRLPTIAELFPEIVDPLLDAPNDLPACSTLEALERQQPFINQVLAYHALAIRARLLRHGELTYQGGFISLAIGRMTPLLIGNERPEGKVRGCAILDSKSRIRTLRRAASVQDVRMWPFIQSVAS